MNSPPQDEREALLVAHGRSPLAAHLLVRAFDALKPTTSPNADELDELAQFSDIARHTLFLQRSRDEGEQHAILDDLSSLMKYLEVTDVSLLDGVLEALNWSDLCFGGRRFHGRTEGLRRRADQLGLLPSTIAMVSKTEIRAIDYDAQVRDAVIRDPDAASIWWEQLGQEQDPITRINAAASLFRAASGAGPVSAEHLDLCCRALGLDGADRSALAARPCKALSAMHEGRLLLGDPRCQSVSMREGIGPLDRLFLRIGSGTGEPTWPGLEGESPAQLVDLVEYWMHVVVSPGYRSDVLSEADAISLLGPLMQAVIDAGDEALALLASRVLNDPPVVVQADPDCREALYWLHGAVNKRVPWSERGPRRAQQAVSPEEAAIHGLSIASGALREALHPHLTRSALCEPQALDHVKGWLLATTGRANVHQHVAPQLVRSIFEGLMDQSRVETVMELVDYAHTNDIPTQSVLRTAESRAGRQLRAGRQGARRSASKLAAVLVQRAGDALDDRAFVGSALSLALTATLTSGPAAEPAATGNEPDGADRALAEYVDTIPPASCSALALVRYARRLMRSAEVFGALKAFFLGTRHDIQGQSHHHVSIPGHEEYGERDHCDLAELLYATGDPDLNPPTECSWPRTHRHLALWHLGRGRHVREFFIDAWQPHYGSARWGSALMGGCDPDVAVDALSEVLDSLPAERHRGFMQEALTLLDQQISRDFSDKEYPKRADGWRRYAPGRATKLSLTNWLPLAALPATRMESLERLAATVSALEIAGRLAEDTWPFLLNLQLILAEAGHPQPDAGNRADRARRHVMGVRSRVAKAIDGTAEIDETALGIALSAVESSQGIRPVLRHLLLLYRDVPEPCVPPSLNPNAFDEASQSRWAFLPRMAASILAYETSTDRVKALRFELNDYLQKRLHARKNEGSSHPEEGAADEQASMIERSRHVRKAYVEALWAIRTNRDAKGIAKTLRAVAGSDPSDDVRATADSCLASRRRAPDVSDAVGIMKGVWEAWWWIRYGTTSRFGDHSVERARARDTLAHERKLAGR